MNRILSTTWTFKQARNTLILYFCINVLLLIAADLYLEYELSFLDFLVNGPELLKTILLYALTIFTFVFPLWYCLIRTGSKWRDLSFKRVSALKICQIVLLGYGLLFALGLVLVVLNAIGLDVTTIPGFNKQEPQLPLFGEGQGALILAGVVAIGIAPILEEVFFRGFLLRSLLSKYPFYVASILTAFLFAFLHFQFQNIWPIFFISLIINYLYRKGGYSVIPTIAFHMVNNAVALYVEYNMDEWLKLVEEIERAA